MRRRSRVVDPRYVAMMNAMMRETLTSGTARKADVPGWAAAGKTGTSQDFRDCLVRRLHQPARHRRVVRQPLFCAGQEGDRRRIAGRSLEPVHEGGAPGKAGHGPSDYEHGRGGIRGPAPTPAAAVPGHSREPIRPAEWTIDGWLMNRLFPRR